MAGVTLRGGPVVSESGSAGWTARGGAAFQETASGGATYTLTAATGSFSLTGNATGLTVARQITAASGGFTLTGNSAALTAARLLTAATGTFTLTGNAADLIYTPSGGYTYTLTAASGSFSLTGNATGLTAARVLAADSGSIVLTGNATGLNRGYPLTAASGAFTLTGNAAVLKADRLLTAASGSFVLTGNAATISQPGVLGAPLLQGIRILNIDTAADIMVMMVDSSDHITAVSGLTLTCELSKNCGAFTAITPTITEIGYGWYKVALTASDIDTEGDLILHVSATGADPSEVMCRVGYLHADIRYVRGQLVDGTGSESDPWGPV